MTDGYIIFHLNLAFSSIEENKRKDVINNCYWPMLKLIENTNICIGVELTGWTLKQILIIDKKWVEKFKYLLSENKCELIGSGWSQLIGPLVPYEVNIWNHKIALEYYQKVLKVMPTIVLVNEMAFSTSLVDIYKEVGYQGFVMDRDNVILALGLENKDDIIPTHALGNNIVSLPILWSDSNMFQKFQRVVHKDITVKEYLEFIKEKINNKKNKILPIYTNDIEIFNFRPGRFTTESSLDKLDEWDRVKLVLNLIKNLKSFNFESPSNIIKKINKEQKYISKITSIKYPIPVKKQQKYNVNRWSVTGRDDLWLNTKCFQIHKNYIITNNKNENDWIKLCEFWSSDFRTHITEKRWKKLVNELSDVNKIKKSESTKFIKKESKRNYVLLKDEENIYWDIKTKKISIILNIRRGLTIKSLGFKSQNFEKVIGTINQGYFNSIKYGVDYYSGGILVEMPLIRKKITDLDYVSPTLKEIDNCLVIKTKVQNDYFTFEKSIKISLINEEIHFSYNFINFNRPIGIIRVGLFTFLNDFLKNDLNISCFNGGKDEENFKVNMNCEHGAAVSSFVSSTTSFGMSGGFIKLKSKDKSLFFKWDTSECSATPLFKHLKIGENILSRLSFSLCEVDDTSKPLGRILPFNLTLSTH
jgi:hypothetical protein